VYSFCGYKKEISGLQVKCCSVYNLASWTCTWLPSGQKQPSG